MRSQYVQKTTPIPADMMRKNGISNKELDQLRTINLSVNNNSNIDEAIINHDNITDHNEKGNNVSVRVPSNKVLPRRSSSKDLRGAVTRFVME